jgi:hypothetical protein
MIEPLLSLGFLGLALVLAWVYFTGDRKPEIGVVDTAKRTYLSTGEPVTLIWLEEDNHIGKTIAVYGHKVNEDDRIEFRRPIWPTYIFSIYYLVKHYKPKPYTKKELEERVCDYG